MSKISMAVPLTRVNNLNERSHVSPDNFNTSNDITNLRSRRNTGNTELNIDSVTTPLISHNNPPLASPEIADEYDDRTTVSGPYPGVDDGFFAPAEDIQPTIPDHPPDESSNPDVDTFNPKDPDEIPEIFNRAGGGEGEEGPDTDEADGKKPLSPNVPDVTGTLFPNKPGRFPYTPSFGIPDIEIGSGLDPAESIPDLNIYQHKKTLAQGMMDLALLSANANQLRYVLESYDRHPYFYPSLVMISMSLILQIAVGIGLIWNATYNIKNEKHLCIANKINNFTIIGIFLVTIVNVFVSAFGVASPPTG